MSTEHKKEVESKDMLRFTRKSKKATDEQQNKSAITDHATKENHVIDWNGVNVVGHETDYRTRRIKEAIAVCKHKGEPDLESRPRHARPRPRPRT